jgi:P27 family predicted phage terminase small subunit
MPNHKKPNAIKKLEGNPGKRPLNENEPVPGTSRPRCPAHLNIPAQTEWKRIVPQLEALGLITQLDRAALAAYCQAYGRWIEAERMIAKHGTVIKNPNGGLSTSPFLWVANKAIEQMYKYLLEFGLTPVSRTRVSVAKPGENDVLEDIMQQAERLAREKGF